MPRPPKRPKIDPQVLHDYFASYGRQGGLKGGKARAAKMTPEERAESARKAARARWGAKAKTAHG